MTTGTELKKEIRNANPEFKHKDLSIQRGYGIVVKKFCQLSKVSVITEKHGCSSQFDQFAGADIDIPADVLTQVEIALEGYQKVGSQSAKEYHLSYALPADCEYFKDWPQDDIKAALPLIEKKSQRLANWMNY